MTTYEEVALRIGAVADHLHRTLRIVAVMLTVAAVSLGVGVGASDEWSRPALVLAAVLGGFVGLLAIMVFRFGADVRRVSELPRVSRQDLQAAAVQLGTRAREGERRFMEARGLRKLPRLAGALRALNADIDTLSEGGLAPAVALGHTLVPTRLLAVGLSAVVSPLLLALGLFVLVLGLTLG